MKTTPTLLLSAAILCGCSTQQPVDPSALVNVTATNLGRSGIMFGGNTNEIYELTLTPQTNAVVETNWFSAPTNEPPSTNINEEESLADKIQRVFAELERQLHECRYGPRDTNEYWIETIVTNTYEGKEWKFTSRELKPEFEELWLKVKGPALRVGGSTVILVKEEELCQLLAMYPTNQIQADGFHFQTIRRKP